MPGIELNFVPHRRLGRRSRNRYNREGEQSGYTPQINPANGLLGSAYLR
jgi:hypothetical protein